LLQSSKRTETARPKPPENRLLGAALTYWAAKPDRREF
jgi:hypothetical protein